MATIYFNQPVFLPCHVIDTATLPPRVVDRTVGVHTVMYAEPTTYTDASGQPQHGTLLVCMLDRITITEPYSLVAPILAAALAPAPRPAPPL